MTRGRAVPLSRRKLNSDQQDALTDIYNQYHALVRSHLRGDTEFIDDISSRIWLQMCERWYGYDGDKSSPKTFLLTALRQTVWKYHRSQGYDKRAIDAVTDCTEYIDDLAVCYHSDPLQILESLDSDA